MSENEKKEDLFDKKNGFKDINYEELIKLYETDNYIPYAQYLRTNLWKSKRLEILDRDNFRCRKCGGYETVITKKSNYSDANKTEEVDIDWSRIIGISWTDLNGDERWSSPLRPEGKPDKPYNIQIHHKKYILNRLPWDYGNEDLISLCNYCHSEEHKINVIPIYDENEKEILDFQNCERCNGQRYFPEFKHIQGGVCFKCGGTGYDLPLINKKNL